MDGSQNGHNQSNTSSHLPPAALTSNINSQIENLSLGSSPRTGTPGAESTPIDIMSSNSTTAMPSVVSPEFSTSALSTTEDLPEQRIFPGIVHERIRKERGEENDAGAGAGTGDMENGSKVGKKPVWNLDGMDDE